MPVPACSNLATLALLIRYQRHLSLRVLVLQPLAITLIMLASTAALVILLPYSKHVSKFQKWMNVNCCPLAAVVPSHSRTTHPRSCQRQP